MLITSNEWLLINDIILDIYHSDDDKEMRKRFLRKIRFLIPYSKANFFLASSDDEHYIQDPVNMGFDEGYLHDYFGELEKHDFMNWIYASAQNNVYLLTELLPAEELNKSLYFRRYFIPNNIEYAAIISLSYQGTHLGVLTLFRAKESSDFSDRDKQILSLLKDHLASYLYRRSSVAPSHRIEPKALRKISLSYGLTPREIEILSLLIGGENVDTICRQLFISNNTLRKHLSNLYKKFGINKRSELNKILYEHIE